MIGFTTEDERIDNCHSENQKSILEEFPEYDFKMLDQESRRYKIILMLFILIPPAWTALVFFFVTGFFSRLKKLNASNPKIVYIQNTFWWTKTHCFIVDENRKWGMIDGNLEILIQPQYDTMKWIKKRKLIEVKSGSKTMLIDIRNNYCM